MKLRSHLLAISLVTLGYGVAASEAKADEYLDRCIESGPGTSAHNYTCAAELMAREDTSLNQVWRRVYGFIKSQIAREALLDEQRKWIAFKEASCELYKDSPLFGSIGWSVSRPMCKVRIIRQRIEELEAYHRAMS